VERVDRHCAWRIIHRLTGNGDVVEERERERERERKVKERFAVCMSRLSDAMRDPSQTCEHT
jgi:hypothetical protein